MMHSFPLNTRGRDFAVSDIHGYWHLLSEKLLALNFKPGKDRLFIIGDMVDRGPHSLYYRAWLAVEGVHALMGNHEDFAVSYLHGHIDIDDYHKWGGGWFIGLEADLQWCIVRQIQHLPLAMEVQTRKGLVGMVHADCPFPTWGEFKSVLLQKDGRIIPQDVINHALFERQRIKAQDTVPIPDLYALLVGHTPVRKPTVLGNVHYIDGGVYKEWGDINVVDLSTL